jgi:hypothetical protein
VDEARALRLLNDFAAVDLAIQTLEDPDTSPADRATASRIARHRLRGAIETIRRLARSQDSALGGAFDRRRAG